MVTTNVNLRSQTAFSDLVQGMEGGNQDRHVRFKGAANPDGTVTLYTHQKFSLTALKGWLGFTGAVNARARKQESGLAQVRNAIKQQFGEKFAEVVAEKAFQKLGVGNRITVGQLNRLEAAFKDVQAENTEHVRQLAASGKPELAYLMALHYGYDQQQAVDLINKGKPEENQWTPKPSLFGSLGAPGGQDLHFSLSKFIRDAKPETAEMRKPIETIFQGAASQAKLESTIREMAEGIGAKRSLSSTAFNKTLQQVMLHLANQKSLDIQTKPLGSLSEDLWQGASNFVLGRGLERGGVSLENSFAQITNEAVAPLKARLDALSQSVPHDYKGEQKSINQTTAMNIEKSVEKLRGALKLLGDNLNHNGISWNTAAQREALFDGQLKAYAEKLVGSQLADLGQADQEMVWTSVRAVWVENPAQLA